MWHQFKKASLGIRLQIGSFGRLKMLTNEDIKQIFFQCEHKDPKGFYADEVDIIEFAKKIEAKVLEKQSKKAPE